MLAIPSRFQRFATQPNVNLSARLRGTPRHFHQAGHRWRPGAQDHEGDQDDEDQGADLDPRCGAARNRQEARRSPGHDRLHQGHEDRTAPPVHKLPRVAASAAAGPQAAALVTVTPDCCRGAWLTPEHLQAEARSRQAYESPRSSPRFLRRRLESARQVFDTHCPSS